MASKKDREKQKKRVVSAKKWAEEHEVGGGRSSIHLPEGASFFGFKEAGTKRIDIIPYTVGKGNPDAEEGELFFMRTYFTHRGIGPNEETFVCLAKTFKKDCPICQHRAKLVKEGGNEDEIKSLTPKERQLWNVFDHNDSEKGVQVWDQSYHLFGKHLKNKIDNADEDDGYELFADPEQGMTLKVSAVQEKAGAYKFLDCSDIEFKARKEPLDDELLEQAHCLDDLLKETSYDELKKIFLGTEDGDDDDDDKPKKGKKDVKKKSKDDDDDESSDDDEDSEDSDDDEDDAPKSKKSEKMKKAKDFGLKVGDLVTYDDDEYEIVRVSGDGTSLTLEDQDGKKKNGIDPADVEKIKTKDDEDEDSEDDDEDEKPKGKKDVKKKSSKDDDDEEDDEEQLDEDDEDSDDEDSEDDDSDDEDDEDDDEDEKPKKGAKGKKGKK